MSLVADIIASTKESAGQADAMFGEMEKLCKQAEEARVTVCQGLSSHYLTLSSTFMDINNLQAKLRSCLQDISDLESNIKSEVIPSVKGSASEIERVTLRWKEMKTELEATQLLLHIHSLMNESHTSLLSIHFDTAVCNLNKIEDLLDEASTKKVENQLEILSALREELVLKRTDLVCRGEEVWNKFVSFNEEELSSGTKAVTLSIHDLDTDKKEGSANCTKQILSALNALGELQRCIRSFGKNLFHHFITPILCDCGKLEVSSQEDSKVDTIHVKKPPVPAKVKDTASAVKALIELEALFNFLGGHFSKYPFKEEDKEIHLLSLLGVEIGDEFIKLVLNSCLEESVPYDRKDLQCFNEVQTHVEEFHKLLVRIGFYGDDRTSLLNYVANVETVYGNKTCSNILMKARNLMVKALNVTATIAPLEPDGPLVAADWGERVKKGKNRKRHEGKKWSKLEDYTPSTLILDEFGNELKETTLRLKNLSPKTFSFPRCKVSVSMCELVTLIYDTLEEGCISTPEFAARLFNTVRNILSMYYHVIPMAHAHALATAPEQAGLVHNNSLFLSHHALLLGHNYMNRFPDSLRCSSFTTADLGYLIRSSGCEVFLKAMQNHKNTLTETLRKGAESTSVKSDVTTVSPLHSSVKECVQQLQRLRDAWQGVLAHSVYIKAMGTLAGSVVEDLVLRIVALEEVSADEAIGLINVLSLLTTNILTLFEEGDEVTTAGEVAKEVRLWEKMSELIVVLGASLRELEERWLEGKGPLAYHFTASEVKHLIKAIFQNTERRAQLLAKIK